MHKKTQDAMTYVKTYGRPDLFITFTCNLKWTEISEVLLPCQAANHRHDIVARVFCQKVIKLMGILTKSARIFGKMQCDMYSIEWQKRGLPHAHILLWLKEKIRPNQIDDIIFAELPAPREDPKLFEVVKTQMVHGPCGRFNPHSPCMDNGIATRGSRGSFSMRRRPAKMGIPCTGTGSLRMEASLQRSRQGPGVAGFKKWR